MKAVGFRKFGGPEVLEALEIPPPQSGGRELLIEVRAAGINRADILMREGKYPVQREFPIVPGFEVAGVVKQIGPVVSKFKIGERVLALLEISGYVEQVAVIEDFVLSIPPNLGFEEAAGIPDVFLTAWMTLFEKAKLQRGETVLIHAAGSGIGIAAIQLAKLFGARVITTASSKTKLEKAESFGAGYTINYNETDFAEKVLEITGGKGVEVILDGIGAETLEGDFKALAPFGRLILIGTVGGRDVQVHLGKLIMKNITVHAFRLHGHSPSVLARYFQKFGQEILPLFAEKKLRSIVDKTFPFSQAGEAHRYLEERKNFGKVVLVP